MLFNIFVKLVTFVIIPIIFLLNNIFKLCVSSKNTKTRFYFNFFIYYFSYFLASILALPALLVKRGDTTASGAFAHITKYVCDVMCINPIIRNPEELALDRAAVVVQNHQSSLDLLLNLLIWNIPKKVIGVSKREIQYIFPLGLTSYLTGSCLISRHDKNVAYTELKVLGENMIKKKAKAWFFPEGTRNCIRETFLPFKKGAFHLAIEYQVPVIPVVSSPFMFLNYEKPSFEKPIVIIRVLDAVPTTGLTKDDIPELMETVRSRMLNEYQKLYEEVAPYYTSKSQI